MGKINALDNNLERLIKIDKSLLHLFQDLGSSDKREKNLEYLSMILEVENNILKDIDFTLENCGKLIKRYLYLISKTECEEAESASIARRFQNYLEAKSVEKPFRSMQNNKEKATEENVFVISSIAHCDYIINLLFLFSDEIEKTNNPVMKSILESTFYHLCFENKIFEQAITNKIEEPTFNRRERCIAFGHEREIVDITYQETASYIINSLFDYLFQYPDQILKESSYDSANQHATLLNLKGASYLLNEEELNELYQKQYTTLTMETPLLQQFFGQTTTNILSVFKSSCDEVKTYSKKNISK